MASPRHAPQPALNIPGPKYPMVSDRLYDYEFALRNTEKLLNQDPKIREADRKLIQAFMRHIKAQGVSVGRLAKYLTDSELKRMYGWSMASRMPAVYIHLSAADLDEKYQQVYGAGRPVEPPKPNFSPTICPRCQEKASPGMLYCPKCATPLDQAERAKMAMREQNTMDEMAELRKLLKKYLDAPIVKEGDARVEGRKANPDKDRNRVSESSETNMTASHS